MAEPRANPRLAKIHRSYVVEEIASLYGAHCLTAGQWIKAGQPVVDQRRPVLVLGAALAEYLQVWRAVNKCLCRTCWWRREAMLNHRFDRTGAQGLGRACTSTTNDSARRQASAVLEQVRRT